MLCSYHIAKNSIMTLISETTLFQPQLLLHPLLCLGNKIAATDRKNVVPAILYNEPLHPQTFPEGILFGGGASFKYYITVQVMFQKEQEHLPGVLQRNNSHKLLYTGPDNFVVILTWKGLMAQAYFPPTRTVQLSVSRTNSTQTHIQPSPRHEAEIGRGHSRRSRRARRDQTGQ